MWTKQATEKAKQAHDQNPVKTKYDNAKPMAAGRRFMASSCIILRCLTGNWRCSGAI